MSKGRQRQKHVLGPPSSKLLLSTFRTLSHQQSLGKAECRATQLAKYGLIYAVSMSSGGQAEHRKKLAHTLCTFLALQLAQVSTVLALHCPQQPQSVVLCTPVDERVHYCGYLLGSHHIADSVVYAPGDAASP